MIIVPTRSTEIGNFPNTVVIGSCRIRDLMSSGIRKFSSIPGFTHNLKQKIQVMNCLGSGSRIWPIWMDPLIFGISLDASLYRKFQCFQDDLKDIQDGIVVIEWSSLNEFTIDGHYVNENYLGHHIVRPGGMAWVEWWSNISRGGEQDEEINDAARRNTGSIDSELFPPEVLDKILTKTKRGKTDIRTAKEDFDNLLSLLPDNSQLAIVVPYEERGVTELINQNPGVFYDKNIFLFSEIVDLMGLEIVFNSDGKDLSHLNPEAIPSIKKILVERMMHQFSKIPRGKLDASGRISRFVNASKLIKAPIKTDGLKKRKILLVVDPRCITAPLVPEKFDSWGTVYAHNVAKELMGLGIEVKLEDVGEIVSGKFSNIGSERDFDAAIIILNYASKIYGQSLFNSIRSRLCVGGVICSLDDVDDQIEFEDVRLAASILQPDIDSERKHLISWGCAPENLVPMKDQHIYRVLLDTWHFEKRSFDRTRDILKSAIDYFKVEGNVPEGKKSVEILCWGNNGLEIFDCHEDLKKLARKPPRIKFNEMMDLLCGVDLFMVTHSESMGLTILEAAMAGCLVALPVPAMQSRDIGHLIKPSLAKTIPRVEYAHMLHGFHVPWENLTERHLRPSEIRNQVIDMTWGALVERIAVALENRLPNALSKLNQDSTEMVINASEDMQRVGLTLKYISNPNDLKNTIEFLGSWAFHPNMDIETWDSLVSKFDLMDDFNSSIKRDFQTIFDREKSLFRAIDYIGNDPAIVDAFRGNLTLYESRLIKFWMRYNGDLSKHRNTLTSLREAVLSGLDRRVFQLFISSLEGEERNWSLDRIFETHFSSDIRVIEESARRLVVNEELWALSIKMNLQMGRRIAASELASEAISLGLESEMLHQASSSSTLSLDHVRSEIMGLDKGANLRNTLLKIKEDGDMHKWSTSRILQDKFGSDHEILTHIVEKFPENIDHWRLAIRSLHNSNLKKESIEIAKKGVILYPQDEWMREISERGG